LAKVFGGFSSLEWRLPENHHPDSPFYLVIFLLKISLERLSIEAYLSKECMNFGDKEVAVSNWKKL
jgi:hypothetical protein